MEDPIQQNVRPESNDHTNEFDAEKKSEAHCAHDPNTRMRASWQEVVLPGELGAILMKQVKKTQQFSEIVGELEKRLPKLSIHHH